MIVCADIKAVWLVCLYEMLCAIWYHLLNFKNTHGGVILLLKVTLLHFLNFTNVTKSCTASHVLTKRQKHDILSLYFFPVVYKHTAKLEEALRKEKESHHTNKQGLYFGTVSKDIAIHYLYHL